ncbi:GNAT family N-acetyltransferase [Limnoglobus roseus]|uniref:N-acetyltransferase n=1 Tax=Limnoglobus roseus TaxID=2598579 RepID=A0A5C1AI19_9BACT|nr:GNAT family protein [Limnoglobus roseus]QEL17646.1 N-acetyltransferase [Limnoglobus roseus]
MTVGKGRIASGVRLRPWQEADVPELVRLAGSRRLADQLRDTFPHPYTTEAGRGWVALANAQSPVTHLAVVCDVVLVGSAGYVPGRDVERVSAEVGYWVGEPHWGRGLATAALVALVNHVCDRGGFTRLFALPFARNAASRRVLEKAGFTLDAVLRQSAIKGGRVTDQALYSLVLSERERSAEQGDTPQPAP